MALFTPEELEELRRADEELEKDFRQTQEEIEESRQRDRQAHLDGLDNKGRKVAAQQRAYYEANREAWNKYQREYARQRRAQRKAAGELKEQ